MDFLNASESHFLFKLVKELMSKAPFPKLYLLLTKTKKAPRNFDFFLKKNVSQEAYTASLNTAFCSADRFGRVGSIAGYQGEV